MASKGALQDETLLILDERPATSHRLPGGGDRGLSRCVGREHAGNRVRVHDILVALELEGCGQRALPRAIRTSNQGERRHFRQRLR